MLWIIIFATIGGLFAKSPQIDESQTVIESQFEPLIANVVVRREKILPEAAATSTMPAHVQIKGTPINLPVKQAKVVGNTYDFFEDAASHLETSASPGEGGNIVLYAHNEGNLFDPLHDTKIGSEVVIDTGGRTYRYMVKEKKVVHPSQLEVIAPTHQEKVTLLTCTGEEKTHRLVVVAEPIATFGQILEDPINL